MKYDMIIYKIIIFVVPIFYGKSNNLKNHFLYLLNIQHIKYINIIHSMY